MLTRAMNVSTNGLIRLSILFGLLFIPVVLNATGDSIDNERQHSTEIQISGSDSEINITIRWTAASENMEDEDAIKTENWMFDKEDPFWDGFYHRTRDTREEEEEILRVENWMNSPSSWLLPS